MSDESNRNGADDHNGVIDATELFARRTDTSSLFTSDMTPEQRARIEQIISDPTSTVRAKGAPSASEVDDDASAPAGTDLFGTTELNALLERFPKTERALARRKIYLDVDGNLQTSHKLVRSVDESEG